MSFNIISRQSVALVKAIVSPNTSESEFDYSMSSVLFIISGRAHQYALRTIEETARGWEVVFECPRSHLSSLGL